MGINLFRIASQVLRDISKRNIQTLRHGGTICGEVELLRNFSPVHRASDQTDAFYSGLKHRKENDYADQSLFIRFSKIQHRP